MTNLPLTDEQRALARRLRAELAGASDEDLDGFLRAYSLGNVAGALVAQMTPDARVGFFAQMRRKYPEARAGEG